MEKLVELDKARFGYGILDKKIKGQYLQKQCFGYMVPCLCFSWKLEYKADVAVLLKEN